MPTWTAYDPRLVLGARRPMRDVLPDGRGAAGGAFARPEFRHPDSVDPSDSHVGRDPSARIPAIGECGEIVRAEIATGLGVSDMIADNPHDTRELIRYPVDAE